MLDPQRGTLVALRGNTDVGPSLKVPSQKKLKHRLRDLSSKATLEGSPDRISKFTQGIHLVSN